MSENHIGSRLREIRGRQSREEFALEMGTSVSSLRRYEEGEREPDLGLIRALHDRRGVDLRWLILGVQHDGSVASPSPKETAAATPFDAELLSRVVEQLWDQLSAMTPRPSGSAFARLCVGLYEVSAIHDEGKAGAAVQEWFKRSGSAGRVEESGSPLTSDAAVRHLLESATKAPAGVELPVPTQPGLDPQVAEMIGAMILEELFKRGRKVSKTRFQALCRSAFALPHSPGTPPAATAISHLIEQELARDGVQPG